MPELHQAHGSLSVRHPEVESDIVEIEIPVALAHGAARFVDRQILTLWPIGSRTQGTVREHPLLKHRIAGNDHPAFAHSGHVLLLVKAEHADTADRARLA